jgi:hypothetical protein
LRSDNYSGQNPTNKEPFTEIDRTSGKLSTSSLSRFGTLPNTAAAGACVNENHPAHADKHSASRRLCCNSSISFSSLIEVGGSDAAPDSRRHSSSFLSSCSRSRFRSGYGGANPRHRGPPRRRRIPAPMKSHARQRFRSLGGNPLSHAHRGGAGGSGPEPCGGRRTQSSRASWQKRSNHGCAIRWICGKRARQTWHYSCAFLLR